DGLPVRDRLGLMVGLGLGFVLGATSVQAQPALRPYAGLDLLAEVFGNIADYYVEPVPQEELAHRALVGLAGSLDPFSAFSDLGNAFLDEHRRFLRFLFG
ncbi:MAG: hypothetical protein ACKOX5_08510, partial [Bacteroidota bacterium]